jgi:hypothetical protein
MLMIMNQHSTSQQQPMLTCRRWLDLARCGATACRGC